MEQRAAFDAWLHSEAGLSFQDVAQLTPQEIARLQLGWLIRERDDYSGGRSGGAETQKRKIQRGQQRAREDMYQDLGIH